MFLIYYLDLIPEKGVLNTTLNGIQLWGSGEYEASPLFPLLPGPLSPVLVLPNRVLSMRL